MKTFLRLHDILHNCVNSFVFKWHTLHSTNVICMLCLYTIKKHLDYFNHILRLSQLHQCDQEMLPTSFSLKVY